MVAVGEIHYYEVIFVRIDSVDKLICHFGSAHLRLQVVSRHFRRSYKNTVLSFERSLASAVEEECHMGIFLSLGYVKLFLAVDRQVFGKSVGNILLVKEDLDTFERIVIGSHAIILQIGYGVHSIL